jgi:hypothetical protein
VRIIPRRIEPNSLRVRTEWQILRGDSSHTLYRAVGASKKRARRAELQMIVSVRHLDRRALASLCSLAASFLSSKFFEVFDASF